MHLKALGLPDIISGRRWQQLPLLYPGGDGASYHYNIWGNVFLFFLKKITYEVPGVGVGVSREWLLARLG